MNRKGGVTTQIVVGLVLGVVVGYLWPAFGVAVKPLADAFLRMIKMIIAPLVFSTLVVGIAGTGDLKAMGRIGLKAIVYLEIATTIALALGLVLVNVFQPGAGLSLPVGADTSAAVGLAQSQQHGWDIFLHLFPTSVVDAMARGDILQVVVFSTFFGVAVAAMGPKGEPVLTVLESTAQVMFRFTGYVMMFAPVGVFAAIASTVGSKGLGVLFTLGKLVGLMYLGLAVFGLIVIGGVSYLIRVPFLAFVRAIREPFLIAFTTASSEAALPKAMEVMERFGVPKNIVAFVLPTGYSFNLDGSTLYLSLTSVFVAQIAGVHMGIGQQIFMMLTLMLTSKGVAGVPRTALVVLAATLSQFDLPLEGAAILLGIDQIMDMGRTAVNVMGNCIATAVVARWEGVLNDEQMRAFAATREDRSPSEMYRETCPPRLTVRIAVVGARGQLGAAIVQECAGHDVVALTRQQFDITDDRAVADTIARVGPDAVVNCAAYNQVDAAEDHPDDALNHNAFAARTLAIAADRAGAWFVHYGSDFVFDGTASAPYTEDDHPNPRSTYGASKMIGDWFALDVPRSYVLRVESLFGRASGGGPPKGSVAGIMNGLLAGSSPPVFEDRTVSPTYIIDAARATRHLLESGAAPGLYHCVSSGHCTWLDFGRELARLLGVEPKLTPVKVADVTLRARRPQFCALSNEKLRRAGFDMPTWQDALGRYTNLEVRT